MSRAWDSQAVARSKRLAERHGRPGAYIVISRERAGLATSAPTGIAVQCLVRPERQSEARGTAAAPASGRRVFIVSAAHLPASVEPRTDDRLADEVPALDATASEIALMGWPITSVERRGGAWRIEVTA
ncbi:MAG: hypothetical protein AAGN46_01260 [Acidobacteriota bacterium]